jgi:hypothetical protein
MKTWLSGRISTAKTGWLMVLLMLGWIVFLIVPFPSNEKHPVTNSLPAHTVQTKLESAGLDNNPDWLGLPDYFAVWADNLEWVENRTYFAYWNPGSSSYSYFFEAIRGAEGIRFHAIPAQLAGIGSTLRDDSLFLDENELAEFTENREANSPTHPFAFSKRLRVPRVPVVLSTPSNPAGAVAGKVEVNADAQPISIPVVKLPEQPDVAPQK